VRAALCGVMPSHTQLESRARDDAANTVPPQIGVAIPAYNAAAWLAETLESVLAQTAPAVDVVVVDDGSTDETASIAQRYAPVVRLLRQENRGVCNAYNRAFAAVRGEFVAMCSADDLWERQKLEWQTELLGAHPEVDVAFGHAVEFGQHDVEYERPPGTGVLDTRGFFRAMYARNYIPAPSAVVRRELHERLGRFDETLWCEDYDFWMRALAAGAIFAYDPRPLVRMRRHGGNISSNLLRTREMDLQIRRTHRVAVGDPRGARRLIAVNLRDVGHHRLLAGDVRGAGSAYRAAMLERPTVKSVIAAVSLSAPGVASMAARAGRARSARTR